MPRAGPPPVARLRSRAPQGTPACPGGARRAKAHDIHPLVYSGKLDPILWHRRLGILGYPQSANVRKAHDTFRLLEDSDLAYLSLAHDPKTEGHNQDAPLHCREQRV
jgi:hypothetical protein